MQCPHCGEEFFECEECHRLIKKEWEVIKDTPICPECYEKEYHVDPAQQKIIIKYMKYEG
jgi:Zn finger protein HypA/HybF involved in hydrogenase expression